MAEKHAPQRSTWLLLYGGPHKQEAQVALGGPCGSSFHVQARDGAWYM